MLQAFYSKHKAIFGFSAFLMIFTIFIPKSYALVVAPFIAVGAVQLIVWLIGILSVPVAVVVKTIGKTRLSKTLFITGIILVITAVLAFIFIKTLKTSKNIGLVKAPKINSIVDLTAEPAYKPSFDIQPTPYVNRTNTGLQFLPTPYIPPLFGLAKVFIIFTIISLVPVFLALLILNKHKKIWNNSQLVLLGLSLSLVLSALVLFILFAYYFNPYISTCGLFFSCELIY